MLLINKISVENSLNLQLQRTRNMTIKAKKRLGEK